jgi:hypothetical protein
MILCVLCVCVACGTSPYHHILTCAQHLQTLRDKQQQQQRQQQTSSSSFSTTSTSSGSSSSSSSSSDGSSGSNSAAEQEAATMAFLAQSGMRECKRCHSGVLKSGGCDKMKWCVLIY